MIPQSKVSAAVSPPVVENIVNCLFGLIFALTGVAVHELTKEQLEDVLENIFGSYEMAIHDTGIPTALEVEVAVLDKINDAAQATKQGIYDLAGAIADGTQVAVDTAVSAVQESYQLWLDGWDVLISDYKALSPDNTVELPYTINVGGIEITPERFRELQANVIDTTGLPSYNGLFQSIEMTSVFYPVNLTNYILNLNMLLSEGILYYFYPVMLVNGKCYTPKYYHTYGIEYGGEFTIPNTTYYFGGGKMLDEVGSTSLVWKGYYIFQYDYTTGLFARNYYGLPSSHSTTPELRKTWYKTITDNWYNVENDSDVINYSPSAKQGLYVGVCAPQDMTQPFINTKDVISTVGDIKDIIDTSTESDVINISSYPLTKDIPITATDVVTVTKANVDVDNPPAELELPEDFPNIKAPVALWDKFPFSLPFDLYKLIAIFEAEPVAPAFNIPFKTDDFDMNVKIEFSDPNHDGKVTTKIIDNIADTEDVIVLFDFGVVRIILRTFIIVFWVLGLIVITNKLIGRG